ncbi:DeoR/GlpR family DNA-binding transcription regulator [Candidatus Galacturonibacter soehngenii]|uniref:DeoR/GlpR transcriptional regulator n=1 Tax=Candidatus Galacturonatibacter soehngenii TaxID=2307010 RepID=A0A7V7QI90_9FIRM|nr:DeoR/GlpR family DNA-binding transcription regulator [Candidatus Galacturonibacter soehngenii]KAB1435759.1 DeoR/GlpR transcriptional regulator [Candidatus Galacturonibacter soehngenii]
MKREKIYVDNRRDKILELVQSNPNVRVNELADKLSVSLITIRRDLQYLEEQKLLKRTHGGAVLLKSNTVVEPDEPDEVSYYRRLIAKYAATLVEDGDSLFINTSSNALQMLSYVAASNVTAITNNGKVINKEFGPGINVILTGGELRYPKDAMVGDYAIRNLSTVFAKKAFVGCSGITPDSGMMTEIASEVSVNEVMVNHSTEAVYVMADHTKIGKRSSFISCSIEKVKYLITDELAPEDILDEFRSKGVIVYQVKKEEI